MGEQTQKLSDDKAIRKEIEKFQMSVYYLEFDPSAAPHIRVLNLTFDCTANNSLNLILDLLMEEFCPTVINQITVSVFQKREKN